MLVLYMGLSKREKLKQLQVFLPELLGKWGHHFLRWGRATGGSHDTSKQAVIDIRECERHNRGQG